MMKDPTEWRKKVAAWKNGTPTSELFNLPKYDDGTDDNQPVVKYYTEKDLDKLFGTYNAPFVKDNNIVPFDRDDWNSNKNDPEMRKDLTKWINELMTDNKVSVNGGELKNVVVTPTKEDKKILRLLKRAVPDKNIRSDIYERFDKDLEWRTSAGEKSNISQNERVKNLVSVWQMSKNPKMYNNIVDKFITDSKLGTPRANYIPILNKFGNIANLDDYISELSHAYQFSPNADKKFRENILLSFLNLPGDISINGKSGYKRPGNLEHTAHSIIQPALENFIMTEKHPSVQALNDRINKQLRWSEMLRNGTFGALLEHKKKSIKQLPKYDGGTDDKTYFPEYEYEATVTPQGTSLEKHKRITNEEDWQKYWGDVGAGYVNQAQESVAKPVLEGLKDFTYFTPLAPITSAVETGVNLYDGDYLGAGLSALAGIPSTHVLYNKALPTIGRLTKPYTNYFASKALSNAIDNSMRSSLNSVKANSVRKMFPTEDEFNFWHGGLDSDFDFKDLDVLRLGSKQAKKGRDYAGFYMYDSFNQPGAFRYGGGEAHGIKIADNAKIFNADFNTERLSVDELIGYQNQGYDLIKGRNVFGEPEYILLNRDAIKSTKFFENFPGHRINMRRPPRPNTNPKNLTNEELVQHWNRIASDLSVDKKAPQSVIDLFDNTDLPKTAKSGAEKFVLQDPNNPQYVIKKFRGVSSPEYLQMKLRNQAILNELDDLILPSEYLGVQKLGENQYVPYFRQRLIKSLDGRDAVLAGKEWPIIQRQGYEAFKNWLDVAKQNPKYSVEDGRVTTEFGHIGDVGPQGNIGVDASGNTFAFDPMLFDADWKKIFDYLYGPILYDKGKSIRINPANKGKFNATKKRTGKTTEQLAHSKNPLTRKRAIFALNSRKWHH